MNGWRTQEVAKVPRGYRVRTTRRGSHLLRIAYPPGPRSKGAGTVVQVLHPQLENPVCNPSELLVMAANGARKNPAELLVMGANPGNAEMGAAKATSADDLHEAMDLHEQFTGAPASEVFFEQRAAVVRETYTVLGPLLRLTFRGENGKLNKIDANGSGIHLCSSPNGQQLYFIGGQQNLDPYLDQFGVAGTEKDLILLGHAERITYFARKEMDAFKPAAYVHRLGEYDGRHPILLYDGLGKEMALAGGNYRVEAPGIIN
jgi:hypothetical protein